MAQLTVGNAREVRVDTLEDRAPHGATWTGDGLESPRESGRDSDV